MKILVLGSGGFIGRVVVSVLLHNHDVYQGDRISDCSNNSIEVDLLDQDSVVSVLKSIQPEIIINCAGTVENSEKALLMNPIITMNILQAAAVIELSLKKLIISGSAGEYGIVKKSGPVDEDTPLMGNSFYARSKVLESSVALALSKSFNIPVIVARIFNPIGVGMHPRFLLPNLIKQVEEVKGGTRKEIELSRLDAQRDYVNIIDIAEAIKILVENDCPHSVYNIGTGSPVSNEQLLSGILRHQGLDVKDLTIIETASKPEPNYAINADVSRMKADFGWNAKHSIDNTIVEVAEELLSERGLV